MQTMFILCSSLYSFATKVLNKKDVRRPVICKQMCETSPTPNKCFFSRPNVLPQAPSVLPQALRVPPQAPRVPPRHPVYHHRHPVYHHRQPMYLHRHPVYHHRHSVYHLLANLRKIYTVNGFYILANPNEFEGVEQAPVLCIDLKCYL